MWYIDTDGYPTNEDFPQDISSYASSPYPYTFWNISSTDNLPELGVMPAYIPNMTAPFPATMWYIDENSDLPELGLMLPPIDLGAFANSIKLKMIKIPTTCKSLGDNTFTNTDLSTVTISSDCTYYSTTFPEGCEIRNYP